MGKSSRRAAKFDLQTNDDLDTTLLDQVAGGAGPAPVLKHPDGWATAPVVDVHGRNAANAVGGAVLGAVNVLGDGLNTAGNEIEHTAVTAGNAIENTATTVGSAIEQGAQDVGNALASAFGSY